MYNGLVSFMHFQPDDDDLTMRRPKLHAHEWMLVTGSFAWSKTNKPKYACKKGV